MDLDLEAIRKQVEAGKPPVLTRKCATCGLPKQINQFYRDNESCRTCMIKTSKMRMKEANRQEPVKEVIRILPGRPEPVIAITRDSPTDPKFRIEVGGHSIKLCRECMREFLGLDK